MMGSGRIGNGISPLLSQWHSLPIGLWSTTYHQEVLRSPKGKKPGREPPYQTVSLGLDEQIFPSHAGDSDDFRLQWVPGPAGVK